MTKDAEKEKQLSVCEKGHSTIGDVYNTGHRGKGKEFSAVAGNRKPTVFVERDASIVVHSFRARHC